MGCLVGVAIVNRVWSASIRHGARQNSAAFYLDSIFITGNLLEIIIIFNDICLEGVNSLFRVKMHVAMQVNP